MTGNIQALRLLMPGKIDYAFIAAFARFVITYCFIKFPARPGFINMGSADGFFSLTAARDFPARGIAEQFFYPLYAYFFGVYQISDTGEPFDIIV